MLLITTVEKMGPLRGDGNFANRSLGGKFFHVEKMGPLRGDGNFIQFLIIKTPPKSREDGSPSRGRKLTAAPCLSFFGLSREDGSPSWGRKPFLITF